MWTSIPSYVSLYRVDLSVSFQPDEGHGRNRYIHSNRWENNIHKHLIYYTVIELG